MAAWKGIPGTIFDLSEIFEFYHSPFWIAFRLSLNNYFQGIVMLCDYEYESLNSRQAWANGKITVPAIRWHFPVSQRLPGEDPFNNHAYPSNRNLRNPEYIQKVPDLVIQNHTGEHPETKVA